MRFASAAAVRIRIRGRESIQAFARHANAPANAWIAVAFIAVTLCYLPVVFFEYGIGDDYGLLAFYDRGSRNMALMIAEGRPLKALLCNLIFPHLQSISALRWLRLLSAIMLGTLAALYTVLWQRNGVKPQDSALISMTTVSLPGFQMVASGAVAGLVTLGLTSAAGAAVLVNSERWGLKRAVLAWLLLVAALMVYQPAAMIFWACCVVYLLMPSQTAFRERVSRTFIVGLSAMPVGFLTYRVGLSLYGSVQAADIRKAVVSEPAEKLEWFVTEPLVNALNLWNIHPVRSFAVAIAMTITLGLWIHFRQTRLPRIGAVLLVVILLLSYLPNLITAQNSATYRTQLAMSAVVVALLIISMRTVLVGHRFTAALTFVAVVGLGSASYNMVVYFAQPQSKELAIVREWLDTYPPIEGEVLIKEADWWDSLAPGVRYDEFGHPSTAWPWIAVDLPYLVLKETRGLRFHRLRLARESETPDIDWGAVLRHTRLEGMRVR